MIEQANQGQSRGSGPPPDTALRGFRAYAGGMILSWPLCTSSELAQVLRPGGNLRPDSALRSLRCKGLAAEPVTVIPRSGQRAHGKVVWYSSLMLDVARLVRVGDHGTASSAHREASRLADQRAAQFVADWLAEHSGPDPDPAQLDADTGGALTRLATLTASARQRLLPRLGIEAVVGRVHELDDSTAIIVDEDGRRHVIPAPASAASDWTGAFVTADYELLGEGVTTVWVRAAFDAEADPNERVPGGPHILTPTERDRLARPVASAR